MKINDPLFLASQRSASLMEALDSIYRDTDSIEYKRSLEEAILRVYDQGFSTGFNFKPEGEAP